MALHDDLARLVAMRESGALTDDEFQRAKASALAAHDAPPPPEESSEATSVGDRASRRRKQVAAGIGAALVLAAVGGVAAVASDEGSSTRATSPTASPSAKTPVSGRARPSARPAAPVAAPASPAPAPVATSAPAAVSGGSIGVADSGWSFIYDNDFAVWGAVIRNPTGDWTAVDVTATALDANGEAVDTNATVSAVLPPHSSVPLGGPFDEVLGMKSVDVSVAVSTTVDMSSVSGGVTATGVVRGVDHESALSFSVNNGLAYALDDIAPLTAVFRDAQGKIIGGGNDYVRPGAPAGATVKFAINAGGAFIAPPGTKTVEAAVPFHKLHLKQ